MTSAKGFYQNLGDDLRRAIKSVMPFRATANGAAAGKVSIIRLGQVIADGETYGRLDGFDIADGDDLVCFTIGGKPVVAKLLTAAPVSHSLSGDLTIGGDVVAGDITATSYNSPATFNGAQSTSDAASTSSTVNYSTAMTLSCALGPGTWTVYAQGGIQLIHSAGGNVNWQINIDGVQGTERTLAANAANYFSFVSNNAVTGRLGTINVTVRFKSSAVGTTSARNPWLFVVAVRTA